MNAIFEVNARKTNSPDFFATNEFPNFQQTRFWAEFKAAHGWKMIPLDIEISWISDARSADDGAKAGEIEKDGVSQDSENGFSRVFVLVRSFAKGLFSIAYVPMYPLFHSDSVSAEFCEVLEKVAFAIRPHLPKNAICVRFDPMLEFDSAQARDNFVREVNAFACKNRRSLKKARVDIQPPDTSLVNLERSEEEILSSMKSKWRYNINLASRKGVEIERVGAESVSARVSDSSENSPYSNLSVSARDELFANLSKRLTNFMKCIG